jgi:hypothetical protein
VPNVLCHHRFRPAFKGIVADVAGRANLFKQFRSRDVPALQGMGESADFPPAAGKPKFAACDSSLLESDLQPRPAGVPFLRFLANPFHRFFCRQDRLSINRLPLRPAPWFFRPQGRLPCQRTVPAHFLRPPCFPLRRTAAAFFLVVTLPRMDAALLILDVFKERIRQVVFRLSAVYQESQRLQALASERTYRRRHADDRRAYRHE